MGQEKESPSRFNMVLLCAIHTSERLYGDCSIDTNQAHIYTAHT